MRCPVVLRRTETGFCAEVPDLPVCVSTGPTFEAALANIQEAILLHREGLREDGEPVPSPTASLALRIDQGEDIITYVDASERRAA